MKIYDCTSFYNEHMMYEVRLNVLADKVDKFIVTESTYSHSGEKKKLNFDIEIDGGINFDNCKDAIEAGANILVSGTTIFKSNDGNIKKNIELLKSK